MIGARKNFAACGAELLLTDRRADWEVALPDTVLEVAEPQCATEVMSDEVVALNVETGVYFSVRELGVALWTDLVAGHSVEGLASMMQAFEGSDKPVMDFVSQVIRYGLMRASVKHPVTSASALRAGFEKGQRELIFEVYEDMKDLILSDPIHDVDETRGWPSAVNARTP